MKKQDNKANDNIAIGAGIGVALGAIIGLLAFDNIGVGIAIGAGVGVAVGAAFNDRDTKKK